MPYRMRIEFQRSGVIPFERPQVIETGGNSPTYALARAVLAMLPLVGASMPGLYRAMIDLRRSALVAGRPSDPPSGEAS